MPAHILALIHKGAREHLFQPARVALALATTVYDESEYYRGYDTFLRAIQELRR